jgi:hypothetical protein
VGVPAAKSEQHALMPALVEALSSFQEELSDVIRRIALAAAVPERLVLDPASHRIDHPVRRAHHMKGIGHAQRVVEVAGHASPMPLSLAEPPQC